MADKIGTFFIPAFIVKIAVFLGIFNHFLQRFVAMRTCDGDVFNLLFKV